MRFEAGVATEQLAVSDLLDPSADEDIAIEIDRLKAKQSTDVTTDMDDDLSSAKNDIEDTIEKLEMLQSLQLKRKTGTSVTFLPDIKVFKGDKGNPDITFDTSRLSSRMDEIAYLNAGLLLSLKDKRAGKKSKSKFQVFYHAGGLAEYVELLCRSKTPLLQNPSKRKKSGAKKANNKSSSKGVSVDPVSGYLTDDGATILCSGESTPANAEESPVAISVALRWSSDMYTETILSFCNNIRTRDGGSHVDGLKASLTRTVNQIARRTGKAKEGASNLPGEFIREGLTAIVSVSVPEPEFEGQTKGRLGKLVSYFTQLDLLFLNCANKNTVYHRQS